MTSPARHTPDPSVQIMDGQAAARSGLALLERSGRRWIFGSFAFCPCHLPLTLGVLATVLGGTAIGAVLRDHAVAAGVMITAAWVAGTWRGFRLVRLAQRGACPVPTVTSGRPGEEPCLAPLGGSLQSIGDQQVTDDGRSRR